MCWCNPDLSVPAPKQYIPSNIIGWGGVKSPKFLSYDAAVVLSDNTLCSEEHKALRHP